MEREGFMCIQIMMPVNEGVDMGSHSGILEFKVSCLFQRIGCEFDVPDERIGGRPVDR